MRTCAGLALWTSETQQSQQQALFVSGRVPDGTVLPATNATAWLAPCCNFSVHMPLLPEHCCLSALLVVMFSLGNLP
jgi:hypothetical protein